MANPFNIDLIKSIKDIETATALLHEQIAFDEQIEDALLFPKSDGPTIPPLGGTRSPGGSPSREGLSPRRIPGKCPYTL